MAEEKKAAAKRRTYVKYTPPFGYGSRELSADDWRLLGAEKPAEATRWDDSNNRLVAREDIPLTDEQLTEYLKQDRALTIVEE